MGDALGYIVVVALLIVVVVLVVALVALRRRDDPRAERQDLERREQRVAERESRLDAEARHLEERARELGDQHDDAVEGPGRARRARGRAPAGARARRRPDRRARPRPSSSRGSRTRPGATPSTSSATSSGAPRTRARPAPARSSRHRSSGWPRSRPTESVVSVLHLPSDDMKGRIIGREGRNIRAFESVTGVNLIIDDSPEAVLLSCFDPVRREVGPGRARGTRPGRAHPPAAHRGDAHERAKTEVDAMCLRAGEDALVEVGITDLHPELIRLLGRLRFRTSYGQNVLKHLLESAHLAALMAGELGSGPGAHAPVRVPARHRQGAHPRGRGHRTRSSAPRSPASTASRPTSCTRSRRTTTRSSRGRSRPC